MRQARPLAPRWRKPPPPPVIQVSGRRAARQMSRAIAAQAGVRPGQVLPVFRFRMHLIPFAWGFLLSCVSLGLYLTHRRGVVDVATGVTGGLLIVLLSRHLSAFARKASLWAGCLTALWLPLIAALGPKPFLPLSGGCWAVLAGCWSHHYRIRPVPPAPELDEIGLWAETLGARGRLAGSQLSVLENIPGGTRFRLRLSRGEQDTADVFGMAKRIASLFGKPVTEAFPERFPDAREHEAVLTLLRRNTLATVVRWDGETIDPATGLAVIGDYPDGKPVLFRFWSPGSGARQSVVVGVTGSGKSYLLYLLICLALTSEVPVIPIVLDPQGGQSLPDVRGAVPYARGTDQCMIALRALEAGIMARSDHLSTRPWTDQEGVEHPGTDFFDPHHCGLPLIFPVFDEAHLVINSQYGAEATRIVGNLVKLNRKAGAHMILASHALLLSELGDNTLRAMVVSGNAIALRTGEGFSGGVIGLEADPKLLPLAFPDGSETHGLGYVKGPSNRPDSPMRARLVANPRKVALAHPAKAMDPVFGDAFLSSVTWQAALERPGAAELAVSLGISTDEIARARDAVAAGILDAPPGAPLTLAAALPDDSPAPGGQTAADAILAVLTRPMERGELLELVEAKAREWGRQPWVIRGVTGPLKKLTEEGRVVRTPIPGRPSEGIYAPPRPSLTVVGGSPRTNPERASL